MVFATSSSSAIISLPSTKVIVFFTNPLFEKNGFILLKGLNSRECNRPGKDEAFASILSSLDLYINKCSCKIDQPI